jgi:hypothetical protein
MNRRFLTLYLFVLVTMLVSCGKKWKQTTDVDIDFKVLSSYSTLLTITSCKVQLSEIDFSGDRKQGGNVSFTDTNPNPAEFIFNTGGATAGIHYDIPQGDYKYMNLHIAAVSKNSTPGISISGIVTEEDSHIDTISILPPIYYLEPAQTIPMIFEFNGPLAFDLNATTTSGNSEILLNEGTPATCEIIFDPYYWFETITKKQFKKASRDTINGVATIVINESENRNLYDSVVTRISQTTKAVFKQ